MFKNRNIAYKNKRVCDIEQVRPHLSGKNDKDIAIQAPKELKKTKGVRKNKLMAMIGLKKKNHGHYGNGKF